MCCIRRDEDGTGKGDGLVTYLKQPSVDLAIQILDGTPLRDGDGQRMSVSQASSVRNKTGPWAPARLLTHWECLLSK